MTSASARTEALIERDRKAIATAIKHRSYPFALHSGVGIYVSDLDGNQYLDWTGAAGVATVGYGDEAIRASIERALEENCFPVFSLFSNEPAVDLAERLVALMPGEFDKKVWYGFSGSDAMDCLAKLTPLASERRRLITFAGSFAGTTIGSAAVSGHGALAHLIGSAHITKVPYPYPYRCSWGPCDPSECSLKCLRFIEQEVFKYVSPAHDVAAIFVESIQSDNGEVVPPSNYLPALRELCDRHNIWLIIDEVKTGLGRTGRMFSFEHSDIIPDAVALGKAIGGGLPLSAVVGRSEILDVDAMTSFTLAGAPVLCSAGLAVLDRLADSRLAENAAAVGAQLLEGISDLQVRHPIIGDVRGRGLMIGVELVKDRKTLEPASEAAADLVVRCGELGLLVTRSGSFENVIEITPALTITAKQADTGLEIFEEALSTVERTG